MTIAAIFTPFAGEGETHDTAFGPAGPVRAEAIGGRAVIWIARQGDARARVVAAKERGAVHAIGLGKGIALMPDVRLGDWLAPADAIDQTRGAPTTFFAKSGLGYLPQSPPFCPETRAALVSAIGDSHSVVVAAPDRSITPAEVKAWGILGGAVAMPGLAPEWYLCREFEIGYAPLCRVCWATGESASLAESAARVVIDKVVSALPQAHSWEGSNTAARRELGDDWRGWIL
jgi:5'-methylthioadenosine phosphorylase